MSSHTDRADRADPSADGEVFQGTAVTPRLLREWALPAPGGSKYGRGQVLVVGGARGTPGAVMLAGRSALRAGAGRLTMAVAESTAVAVAVAVPESGVVSLPENGQGSVMASMPEHLEQACDRADAVLIGSGLDEPEQTAELLRLILPVLHSGTQVILDAYALGVLDQLRGCGDGRRGAAGTDTQHAGSRAAAGGRRHRGGRRRVRCHPHRGPIRRRGQLPGQDRRCQGQCVGDLHRTQRPGYLWERRRAGRRGSRTAGSRRAACPACWATYLHAAAGDRLTARVGALGFLAGQLVDELPVVLTELNV